LRRQSTAAAPRPLQAAHQVAPDLLDQLLVLVEEVGNGLQQRSGRMPCRISSKSAKLICRAVALDTSQLFLLFDAIARSRFNALT
jgi:hypothetical protein